MKKIVILPTYNEKGNIIKIVPKILASKLGLDILIVDDNSPDGTGKIADQFVKKYKNKVFVLHRKDKEGLGKAYIAGFNWALKKNYGIIIQMDADFSHNPKYLATMLQEIKKYDLVIGSRYVKGGGTKGWTIDRKILSRGGSLYSKIILGITLDDLTGGFKCWRAGSLRRVDLDSITSNGYSFQIEMNFRAATSGLKIKEIPIIFVDREKGKSKMSGNIVREAMTKVWVMRFGKKPWLSKLR